MLKYVSIGLLLGYFIGLYDVRYRCMQLFINKTMNMNKPKTNEKKNKDFL